MSDIETSRKMNKENMYKRPENYIHIVANGVGLLMEINDPKKSIRLKKELMEISEKPDREDLLIDRLLGLGF